MRNRARILSLALLMMLAAALFAPLALGEQSASPVITVTPRVETAAIGEPVTFDYAITGVDAVEAIYISPDLEVSPGAYQSLEAIQPTELSGTIELTATYGITLSAYVSVRLPTGQWLSAKSAKVTLTGWTPPEVVITATPRVETAAIGEPVTFDYAITGVDAVEAIYISPDLEVSPGAYQSLEAIQPTELSGTIELTATYGISLSAYVSVRLPTGQWLSAKSAKVTLTGWTPPEVVITATPRVETAAIGEPVTFDYAITGVEDAEAIYISPDLEVSPGAYQSLEAIQLTELSGTIKLTAPFGISLSAYISVQLPTGQWFSGRSAKVELYAPDGEISVLPDGLRHIRAEAFAGSDVQIVICPDHLQSIGSRAFADSALMRITIPETVTDIADDAFEGCDGLTFIAPAGSCAAEYAETHGIPLSQ